MSQYSCRNILPVLLLLSFTLSGAIPSLSLAKDTPTPPDTLTALDLTYDSSFGIMTMQVRGNKMTGSYTHKDGKLTGTVDGTTIKGKWTQSNGAGELLFKLEQNYKVLNGAWNYNHDKTWRHDWTGKLTGIKILNPAKSPAPQGKSSTTDLNLKYDSTFGAMTMLIRGSKMSGSYTHRDGKLTGNVDGLTIKGRWTQSNGAGELHFKLEQDYKVLKGSWNYDHDKTWRHDWTGTLISLQKLSPAKQKKADVSKTTINPDKKHKASTSSTVSKSKNQKIKPNGSTATSLIKPPASAALSNNSCVDLIKGESGCSTYCNGSLISKEYGSRATGIDSCLAGCAQSLLHMKQAMNMVEVYKGTKFYCPQLMLQVKLLDKQNPIPSRLKDNRSMTSGSFKKGRNQFRHKAKLKKNNADYLVPVETSYPAQVESLLKAFPVSKAGCYNTVGADQKCLSRCASASKNPNKTLTTESHYALCSEGCSKGKSLFRDQHIWASHSKDKSSFCREVTNSNRADLEASWEAQSRGMNDAAKSAFKSGVNGYFWATKKLIR